ncbi:Proteinase inhibitor [Linum perenne]
MARTKVSVAGKNSWPELLGKKGHTAAETVERENRHVHAIIIKEGEPMTMNYRCDRVRVWWMNMVLSLQFPASPKMHMLYVICTMLDLQGFTTKIQKIVLYNSVK